MKKLIIHFLFALFLIIAASAICNAQVRVKGYYRKDGTYVRPHVRSRPDGNPYNNWSYPGNVNPYTGKVATGNSETYIKNYRKNRSNISTSVFHKFPISNTQAWVSANVLNVRKSPLINSSIVGKLYYSDFVKVYRLHGNWAFIEYYYVDSYNRIKSQKGYVSVRYLIIK